MNGDRSLIHMIDELDQELNKSWGSASEMVATASGEQARKVRAAIGAWYQASETLKSLRAKVVAAERLSEEALDPKESPRKGES